MNIFTDEKILSKKLSEYEKIFNKKSPVSPITPKFENSSLFRFVL